MPGANTIERPGSVPGLLLRGNKLIAPEALKQPRSAPDFRVITGELKSIGDANDRLLAVTASSNVIDRAGDRMAFSALQDMERGAQDRLTIFVNHEYRVPEDVFGTVETAGLVTREGFVDLDMKIRVVPADQNERADRAYRMITESGTKLGVSIGAQILDYQIVEEAINGVMTKLIELTSLNLLEASIVGIPANQRSWVQNAIKSLHAANPENIKRIFSVPDLGNLKKCAMCDCGCTAESADPNCTCECADCAAVRAVANADAIPGEKSTEPEEAEGETPDVAEQPFTLGVGPDSVKGIIAVELAERKFRETLWDLTYTLERVIWNQMSQEDGDPVAIRTFIRDAIAEFATLMDNAVAAALSAGVAGPQDNDRADTSEDDDCMVLDAVVPALLRSGDDPAGQVDALQRAHDHLATKLNLACASATAEAASESGAETEEEEPVETDEPQETRALQEARDELQRSIDAARSLIEETRASLIDLEGKRKGIQTEIDTLKQERAAELKRGTGRPSQGAGEPVKVSDILKMSNEELLALGDRPLDIDVRESDDPALVGLI